MIYVLTGLAGLIGLMVGFFLGVVGAAKSNVIIHEDKDFGKWCIYNGRTYLVREAVIKEVDND